MKNIIKIIAVLLFIVNSAKAQSFRVRSDEFIQIGYDRYKTLTFGAQTSLNPNNGQYAIEYWSNGLNFWRPWPSSKFGNFILFLRDDHNIGIGTTGSSAFRIDIAGSGRILSQNIISDKRLKVNIKPLESGLSNVLKLKTYSYQYDLNKIGSQRTKENLPDFTENKRFIEKQTEQAKNYSERTFGLLADETREIIPNAVKEDENGILSLDYNQIIPLLIEAIKEQQKEIELLKEKVNSITRK